MIPPGPTAKAKELPQVDPEYIECYSYIMADCAANVDVIGRHVCACVWARLRRAVTAAYCSLLSTLRLKTLLTDILCCHMLGLESVLAMKSACLCSDAGSSVPAGSKSRIDTKLYYRSAGQSLLLYNALASSLCNRSITVLK